MKLRYLISSTIVVITILYGYVNAAELGVTTNQNIQKTITVHKKVYTLNVCSKSDIANLTTKVNLSLKGAPIVTKRRTLTQLKLLQVFWGKSCNPVVIQTGSTSIDNQFTIISNPDFLYTQPVNGRNKAVERANLYQKSAEGIIDAMIQKGILTSTDKNILKGKIEIQYVDNCKQIDGLTTVKQRYNQAKVLVKNELVSIVLNVSTCENDNFGSLFSTSYRHVFIHELGHYVYYMRDTNTKTFEDICWNTNTRKSACLSYETFYSKYAMNDPQEDYAETFAYRYQNKQPEFTLSNPNLNLTTINLKAEHFSTLFKK